MCPFGTHHFQQNDLFGIWALQCFRTQIVKKTPANLPEGHQLCLCPGRAYLGSSAEEVRGEKPVFFYTQNLCREKCKPKKTQGIYLFFLDMQPMCHHLLCTVTCTHTFCFTISFHCVQWHWGCSQCFFQATSCNVLACGGVGAFWNQSYS